MSEEESSQEIELVNRAEETESDKEQKPDQPLPLPKILEELKGENPKIFGYDYYNVIYSSAGCLTVVMAYMYIIIDNPELKRMVMIQGLLSVGLLLCCLYFRKRMQEEQVKRAIEKKKLEDALNNKTKKSGRAKSASSANKKKRK